MEGSGVVAQTIGMGDMEKPHARTLAHVSNHVRFRGTWPGAIQIRKGFGLAHARPWSATTREVAALRLIRGSHSFLEDCVAALGERSVTQVRSPALPPHRIELWQRAGFGEFAQLVVFERSLLDPISPPDHEVDRPDTTDIDSLARVDASAFPPTWSLGGLGLLDAIDAASHSRVLTVSRDSQLQGFAVVGESGGIVYLQRIAVDPRWQGAGIGRSLLRASMGWARSVGGRTMVLNTQVDNLGAAALYESEGFERSYQTLVVMDRTVESRKEDNS